MKKGLIAGFLLGAAAAGVTTLLTTPKKGTDVRTALNMKYQSTKDTVVKTAQTTKQKAQVGVAKLNELRTSLQPKQGEALLDENEQVENILLNPIQQVEVEESVEAESPVTEMGDRQIISSNIEFEEVKEEVQTASKYDSVAVVKDDTPTNILGRVVKRYLEKSK